MNGVGRDAGTTEPRPPSHIPCCRLVSLDVQPIIADELLAFSSRALVRGAHLILLSRTCAAPLRTLQSCKPKVDASHKTTSSPRIDLPLQIAADQHGSECRNEDEEAWKHRHPGVLPRASPSPAAECYPNPESVAERPGQGSRAPPGLQGGREGNHILEQHDRHDIVTGAKCSIVPELITNQWAQPVKHTNRFCDPKAILF